jgi:hypothetical protein
MRDNPHKHWLKPIFRKRDKSPLSRIGKVHGTRMNSGLSRLSRMKGAVRGNGR